jgi:hypothetical protein
MSAPSEVDAVAGQLGINTRAALQRVLQLLQHQHAGAAGNDEPVAVRVVGAGGFLRRVVVAAGERAHRVEHHRGGPVFLVGAARKHHILLAQLDQFHRVADAMRAGGTGRADRIADIP